jgi:hypothetical protein
MKERDRVIRLIVGHLDLLKFFHCFRVLVLRRQPTRFGSAAPLRARIQLVSLQPKSFVCGSPRTWT